VGRLRRWSNGRNATRSRDLIIGLQRAKSKEERGDDT
jgi:hypothetical protein